MQERGHSAGRNVGSSDPGVWRAGERNQRAGLAKPTRDGRGEIGVDFSHPGGADDLGDIVLANVAGRHDGNS